MIFISGPRQVGKNNPCYLTFKERQEGINYFNWDVSKHRRILLKDIFSGQRGLSEESRICFDEIHKYVRWKNSLRDSLIQMNPILTG
jgi:predicted AAA+ superfamily ATPase